MPRHLLAAIMAVLLALAGAGTAAASGLGNPVDDDNEQSQSAGQVAGNKASNEQGSIVVGSNNLQVGANNNTLQFGSGNESNGNRNTADDQTAVNGNNFQQSNEQSANQRQRSESSRGPGKQSGGYKDSRCHSSCEPKRGDDGSTRQSQQAGQSAGNDAQGSRGRCGCEKPGNKQGAIVLGSNNVQIGANNNTLQFGNDNESNGNTNTAGDQTAVNGNNFQQSNEQNASQRQRSGSRDAGQDQNENQNSHWTKDHQRSDGAGHKPSRDRSSQSQGAVQVAGNKASNEQWSFVWNSHNVQAGLNNNTIQHGTSNESNDNTNTVGDQTAVNGNNFQQSNEQSITQEQVSRGSGDDGRPNGGPMNASTYDRCHSSCQPKHGDGGSTRQSQWAGQAASNEAWNKQHSFVYGSKNLQFGGNNNTIQHGSGLTRTAAVVPVDGGNESNGNTNTVGDQTAVNGNNFQQSNEQSITQEQVSRGSGDDGRPNGGPMNASTYDRCHSSCRPKHGDDGSTRQSQWAGQWASNSAWNEQGAIVLGSNNLQFGANNNTLQFGSGNESNGNTNTAGDQTAVNGNNFQQSNEQTIDQEQRSRRSDGNGSSFPCHDRCQPKPEHKSCGCERPKPEHKSCGCERRKPEHKSCGCERRKPEHKSCGCERPKHENEQSQRAAQWSSNRASNEQHSFVYRSNNLQFGGNNNTIQSGGREAATAAVVPDGGGNESNDNTNTAGDQTAVNGNNFQQSNEQSIDQSQRSGSAERRPPYPAPPPVF